MSSSAIREVERRVEALGADAGRRLVLAVSGGLDSMVLLDAAARVARERVAAVATFDHGSGPHAARAAAFVRREAERRALPAVVGQGDGVPATEAAWRAARWTFLRGVAERVDGSVVTAHSEDDQIETVLMRTVRGAGARGLAGLFAPSPGVVRPFLDVRRATLERYAAERGLPWVVDPTNASMRFFRNRVRRELLPALLGVRPGLDEELLGIARRAAAWRREVDTLACQIRARRDSGSLSVAAADLDGYDAEGLAVLWPAIAARIGLALDRRGTRRLAAFTMSGGRAGASMQLAGGWEVVRDRARLTLRLMRREVPAAAELPRTGPLRWGRWSFLREAARGNATGPWRATLPADERLVIRAWRPGDRMVGPSGSPRRVKRFLGDAGIVGPDRAGWPVVLAGEEIVWIPGVGRAAAVTGASRTPGLIYSCELNDR